MDKLTTGTETTNSLDLFKSEFASTVIPVYIKSLDKVVEFREITVQEQKSLSKIQIENQNKPATIYRAFNTLFSNAMITKGINVDDFTEADRYAILFNLYQTAFLDKPQEFTCSNCQSTFTSTINAEQINQNFANLDIDDKVYVVEDATRQYVFTCNFPTIRRLTSVLDLFQRKYMSGKSDANVSAIQLLQSVDYTNAFIKSLTIERLNKSAKPISANFDKLSAEQSCDILSIIPQHILLAEEKGIIARILNDFIQPINSVFVKQTCPKCGNEFSGQIGGIADFLS